MRNPTLALAGGGLFLALVAMTACQTETPEPTAVEVSHTLAGASAIANGGGEFLITIDEGFTSEFAMSNVQLDASGRATGNFRFSLVFFGELVEFFGRTTCLTVDAENGRAWIGGVTTRNNSTHPGFTEDRHQPGGDIWFRVVDYGEGNNAPQADRSTFVGFEGDAGIITSEEYCEVQPWPEGDERTWEVTSGNIQVRIR